MKFAAKLAEIPEWGKKVVELEGREVLLVKAKGEVYAFENECPHQGSPMQGGMLKDAQTITCPRHGYRFNLKTGACADFPEYTLTLFPVKVEGEDVMVEI